MKVLVGIMRYGENEFEYCIESLKRQSHKRFEYFVIENLQNKQAHDQLYSRFMQSSEYYDYFLKLDADMVFFHDSVLEEMCSEFNEDTSRILSWVNDIPSSLKIPGVQMFRSDVIWAGSDDCLNVDYAPKMTGKGKLIMDRNFINHMPNPNDHQLLRYGVHKALKSIQPDRKKKDPKKGILHIAILNAIARNYFSGNEKYILTLIGGMLVYKKSLDDIDYNSDKNRESFEKIINDNNHFKEMKKSAEKFWSKEIISLYRWIDEFKEM